MTRNTERGRQKSRVSPSGADHFPQSVGGFPGGGDSFHQRVTPSSSTRRRSPRQSEKTAQPAQARGGCRASLCSRTFLYFFLFSPTERHAEDDPVGRTRVPLTRMREPPPKRSRAGGPTLWRPYTPFRRGLRRTAADAASHLQPIRSREPVTCLRAPFLVAAPIQDVT